MITRVLYGDESSRLMLLETGGVMILRKSKLVIRKQDVCDEKLYFSLSILSSFLNEI